MVISFDPHGAHDGPIHDHGDDADLRSVDEVRSTVLETVRMLSPIELHLQEAFGCVLASDVVAELDIPAFSSSAMDGFAVRASDVATATEDQPATLRIAGKALIGQAPD